MYFRRIVAIGTISLATLPLSAVFGQAQSTFESGVKAYNSRQYWQAISFFKSFVYSNPNSELAHYYLGLSYQGSNQRSLARAEYEWILKNSINASLKSYASTGLHRLGIRAKDGDPNGDPKTTSDEKSSGRSSSALLGNPTAFFVNTRAGGGGSRDCGPACLAMIFRAFNKYPASFKSWSPYDLIHQSRVLMTGSDVQENTTLEQVEESMGKAGYKIDRFDGVDKLDAALSNSKLVVAVGCPGRRGSYGDRLDLSAGGGHYVVVTGKRFGMYVINDPNGTGPVEVTRDEITSFLDFYKGQYSGCCIAVGL